MHHLKFRILTAWGLNDFSRTPGSHGGDIAKSVMGPSVCPIAVSGWELKPNAFFGISSAPGGCAIPGLSDVFYKKNVLFYIHTDK